MKKSFEANLSLDFGILGLVDSLVNFYMFTDESKHIKIKITSVEVSFKKEIINVTNLLPEKEILFLCCDLMDMYKDDFLDNSDDARDIIIN